ncbi:MAG: hypothetical protein U5K36_07425 [Roseovarius sp.]|nr:hypothetical protein [Roseovarius sp.]
MCPHHPPCPGARPSAPPGPTRARGRRRGRQQQVKPPGAQPGAKIDGQAKDLEFRGHQQQRQRARILHPVAEVKSARRMVRPALAHALVETREQGIDERRDHRRIGARGRSRARVTLPYVPGGLDLDQRRKQAGIEPHRRARARRTVEQQEKPSVPSAASTSPASTRRCSTVATTSGRSSSVSAARASASRSARTGDITRGSAPSRAARVLRLMTEAFC